MSPGLAAVNERFGNYFVTRSSVAGRSRAMTRLVMLLVLAVLTVTLALTEVACETQHVDQNFGTDAGAGFDAPAREVRAGDAAAEAP